MRQTGQNFGGVFRGPPALGTLGEAAYWSSIGVKERGFVPQEWTERTLIEGCRRHDREAQREVYSRTSDRIYRVLLKLTRNADDAMDLAQSTYVQAFTRIDGFNDRSNLSTWLYRIAVNEGLRFLRHAKVEQNALPVMANRTHGAKGSVPNETRLDVAHILAKLTADDQALVALRFDEGLDYAAIAEVLGCPVGTVASRLNKVRRVLAEVLTQEGYGPDEDPSPPAHQTDREVVDRLVAGFGSGETIQLHRKRPGGAE